MMEKEYEIMSKSIFAGTVIGVIFGIMLHQIIFCFALGGIIGIFVSFIRMYQYKHRN